MTDPTATEPNVAPAAPAAEPAAAAPAAPAADWLAGLDAADADFIRAKGYGSTADLAKSLRNAQSLVGEFGSLPKEVRDALKVGTGDDAKALAKKALGLEAPADASGYTNPLGADYDDGVFKAAAAKAHELGLTDAQFQGLVGLLPTMSTDIATQQAEARAAQVTAWQDTNRAEAMQVKVLLTNAGVQAEELADFLTGVGAERGLAVLTKLAKGTTEKPLISPDAAGSTEGAASAKAALMSDPTFLGKLRSSDMVVRAAAIRQLAALNQAMAG